LLVILPIKKEKEKRRWTVI